MNTVRSKTNSIEAISINGTSLSAFYKSMNPAERRTFWACFAGWTLDGMDFMIYPLVIGTIIILWNVDPGTAGLAATVTLLSSALGVSTIISVSPAVLPPPVYARPAHSACLLLPPRPNSHSSPDADAASPPSST